MLAGPPALPGLPDVLRPWRRQVPAERRHPGDQGAGLVWRYRDQNNYYVTRCNALEDNCTIYHVVNGRRQAFQNKRVKVASNVWHNLKMEATGDRFVVTYDGNIVLDAKDETFKEAGKVGLWTKAD